MSVVDPGRKRSLVFQPLPIGRGGLALPNRIWLPAMVTWRGTPDGFVTDAVREIYLRYALGGAGAIVLEAIGVRDVASGPLLRLSDDRFMPGLAALVREMKAASQALVLPQIIDFLKIARRKPTREFMEGMVRRGRLADRTLGLSDAEFEARLAELLPDPREQHDFLYGYRQTVADLELSEIRHIPDWFAAAAGRAKRCGFDGVELHFAHAYTLASFLSVTNERRDRYGGSLANRMRLPLEVLAAVREEVGRDFLVGCRYLGSEDILSEESRIGGNTLQDGTAIGVELARAGCDFLSISRGGKFDDAKQPRVGEAAYPYTGHSGQKCIPRSRQDPFGVNTYLASAIRAALRGEGYATPVITTGKIHTFEQAEGILQEGKADVVGMARALLADPDLPRKWLAGADRGVRACVFCPYCEDEDQHHRVVTCCLWPKDPANSRRHLTPAVWGGGSYDAKAVFEVPPSLSAFEKTLPTPAVSERSG